MTFNLEKLMNRWKFIKLKDKKINNIRKKYSKVIYKIEIQFDQGNAINNIFIYV